VFMSKTSSSGWINGALALVICLVVSFLIWRTQARQRRRGQVTHADKSEASFAESLSHVAPRFDGIYNALATVAAAKTDFERGRAVLRDWERRIEGCDCAVLQNAWSALVRVETGAASLQDHSLTPELVSTVASAWQNQLAAWGICKDNRPQFPIDETESSRYFVEGDYRIGDTAIPELACWMLGKQVLEKGVARVCA
jgi:hypothetical protein